MPNVKPLVNKHYTDSLHNASSQLAKLTERHAFVKGMFCGFLLGASGAVYVIMKS